MTEDILKALEVDHEEREELESRKKNTNEESYEVLILNDDENLVEDIDTGILHPTKVAKIMHIGKHSMAEKTKIKCDHCVFETHNGDVLLHHISATHIKF